MRIIFRCDPELEDRLPKPIAAREALPGWLNAMPRSALSPLHGSDIRTVKHCPPFLDAMTYGFVMPLPCDIVVKDGVFSWDWDCPEPATGAHPRSPLSFHVAEQVAGTPLQVPGQVIVKFNSFWTIELEPGWSLFATHPVNRDDLPFRLISGLVDADRFNDVGILFPAVWSDPGFAGMLPRGTPVAQCFAVRREAPVLVHEVFTHADIERYEATAAKLHGGPGVYRKQFRARRSTAPDEGLAEGFGVEE